MECWQYVCGIPWCELLKPDKCFEGQIGKIDCGSGHEFY